MARARAKGRRTPTQLRLQGQRVLRARVDVMPPAAPEFHRTVTRWVALCVLHLSVSTPPTQQTL